MSARLNIINHGLSLCLEEVTILNIVQARGLWFKLLIRDQGSGDKRHGDSSGSRTSHPGTLPILALRFWNCVFNVPIQIFFVLICP